MVGMGKTPRNGTEKYACFEDLKKGEKEGKDFLVRARSGHSGIAVFAPHGGGIEPGTTEIADAVAGEEHAFYSFIGIKDRGNGDLHLTSTRFDEPLGVELAQGSKTVLAVHGRKGTEKAVYIGGLDTLLKERIREGLHGADFVARKDSRFPGASPHNICNRTLLGRGVQLEITTGLRRVMFQGLSSPERQKRTPLFNAFVLILRSTLRDVASPSKETSRS